MKAGFSVQPSGRYHSELVAQIVHGKIEQLKKMENLLLIEKNSETKAGIHF